MLSRALVERSFTLLALSRLDCGHDRGVSGAQTGWPAIAGAACLPAPFPAVVLAPSAAAPGRLLVGVLPALQRHSVEAAAPEVPVEQSLTCVSCDAGLVSLARLDRSSCQPRIWEAQEQRRARSADKTWRLCVQAQTAGHHLPSLGPPAAASWSARAGGRARLRPAPGIALPGSALLLIDLAGVRFQGLGSALCTGWHMGRVFGS